VAAGAAVQAGVAGHLARRHQRIHAQRARTAHLQVRPPGAPGIADLQLSTIAPLLAGSTGWGGALGITLTMSELTEPARLTHVEDVGLAVDAAGWALIQRGVAVAAAPAIGRRARGFGAHRRNLAESQSAEAARLADVDDIGPAIDAAGWALIQRGVAVAAAPAIGRCARGFGAHRRTLAESQSAEAARLADVDDIGLAIDAAGWALIQRRVAVAAAPAIRRRARRFRTHGHALGVGQIAQLLRRTRIEHRGLDRKSTRLNSSHVKIAYAVFCLKKKK